MEKIRIDVVGLAHWDVRSQWKEYAAGAVGRELVLQPQPENMIDPYAVRAREGRLHIGYVAVPDLDAVYQALKGSGKQRLKGIAVESNPEPPVVTLEIEVEKVDWDYEPYDDSVYAGWHYDGLSLMPKKLEQLKDLTDDLIEVLESSETTDADVLSLIEQLLESSLYDVSREMTRARYRIERLLAKREEPALKPLGYKLRQQKGLLMRHECRDQVARYLFVDLPKSLIQKGLTDYHYTYDNRLDELESQLRAFPYQLYDKFLSDPVDFLREVYYKHVPRKHLFPLLSGIVLMILKGRIRIQRWGREGDREPIEQIGSMGMAVSDTDREKHIKEGLKKLLKKKDARENLIISQKNQWAGLMSVLVFEYCVTDCDMKAFCRQMEEWGFGEESGYENYCDYDSVSKESRYATNAFKDWYGNGTKHKRMTKAVTELRAILRQKIGRF